VIKGRSAGRIRMLFELSSSEIELANPKAEFRSDCPFSFTEINPAMSANDSASRSRLTTMGLMGIVTS
jgi:hypothetical protein